MSQTPAEPRGTPEAPGASERAGLEALNALPADAAQERLLACCPSARWAGQMVAARPYTSAGKLLARSDQTVTGLAQADLEQALAGHPRIGGPSGQAGGWSRREQAGVQTADEATLQALAEGNEAYERRFGHIYLVCASGRDGAQLLALLRERLGNDPAAEWEVVRGELGQINRIRLRRLLAEGVVPASDSATSAITTHVLDTARGVPAAGVAVRLDRVPPEGPGQTTGATTEEIGRARTDADGRIRSIGPAKLPAGTYRLTFGTGDYFRVSYAPSPPGQAPAGQPVAGFFPEVAVTFVTDGETPHYHVPLLLSPFGYSTYRGS